MRKKIILFVSALLSLVFSGTAAAKVYVAEPLLVTQPSYAGMRFYVYKPYNLPKNWYATFDGYPVIKNKDGVWVYGTYHGPNLTPTNFIVGSVIPSMAGLSPYTQPVTVSSATTLNPGRAPQGTAPQVVSQPSSLQRLPTGALTSTYMPDWLFDGRFMALGNWKQSVDRIGILHNPAVPVAWKGHNPTVIYAWTGSSWYQMMARENERPVDVLRNNLYTLTKMVAAGGFMWYGADVPVLSQQATTWGYYWMGEIMPER